MRERERERTLPAENLLKVTAIHRWALGAVACCSLVFFLTGALLMTSSHSKVFRTCSVKGVLYTRCEHQNMLYYGEHSCGPTPAAAAAAAIAAGAHRNGRVTTPTHQGAGTTPSQCAGFQPAGSSGRSTNSKSSARGGSSPVRSTPPGNTFGVGGSAAFVGSEKRDDQTVAAALRDFFIAIALCHTVNVTEKEKVSLDLTSDGDAETTFEYASISPDEDALVRAAAMPSVGVQLAGRTSTSIDLLLTDNAVDDSGGAAAGSDDESITRAEGGEEAPRPRQRRVTYKLLHVCAFESNRMRMSVLVEDPDGNVHLFCKGADSAVLAKCVPEQGKPKYSGVDERTHRHLRDFSRAGFRTLAVASRILTPAEVAQFWAKLNAATRRIAGLSIPRCPLHATHCPLPPAPCTL